MYLKQYTLTCTTYAVKVVKPEHTLSFEHVRRDTPSELLCVPSHLSDVVYLLPDSSQNSVWERAVCNNIDK